VGNPHEKRIGRIPTISLLPEHFNSFVTGYKRLVPLR